MIQIRVTRSGDTLLLRVEGVIMTSEASTWSRRRMLAASALLPLACSSSDSDTPTLGPHPTTPEGALLELRDGNRRFATGQPLVRDASQLQRVLTEASTGQKPFATILGCADSRLSPELIFDQFFGDVFVVREAGNIASSAVSLGSLEYATAVLSSPLLVVLGHASCGAVKASFEPENPGGNIQAIVDAIRPNITGASSIDDAITKNVRASIAQIRRGSPVLAAAESAGTLRVVGAVYTIATGTVTFLD